MPGVPTCARVRAKSHKGKGGGGHQCSRLQQSYLTRVEVKLRAEGCPGEASWANPTIDL